MTDKELYNLRFIEGEEMERLKAGYNEVIKSNAQAFDVMYRMNCALFEVKINLLAGESNSHVREVRNINDVLWRLAYLMGFVKRQGEKDNE